MRKLAGILFAFLIMTSQIARAQDVATAVAPAAPPDAPAAAGEQKAASEEAALRAEIELMKQQLAAMEQRLAAQEKKEQGQTDTTAAIKDLDRRVMKTERDNALDRVRFGGDYRFEAHSIQGDVPAHYDGMKLQNLVVRTMFTMGALGRPPASIDEINSTVAAHYSDYQYFTQNLTFDQLKQAMGQFPPEMQQQLFGMLMPATRVDGYEANNGILYTNRFRLKVDAPIAENVSVTARLSMYKVFGDSTGVQVFNGQPTSLNIDGTTAGVPNGDMLRVERAYFTWNNIGDSKFFLSVGRRPSTDGPPMNFRDDEPRGGTPSGALINYQFDGITFGYHLTDETILRLCYGVGFESGFGNGELLQQPQDRMKDVHFLGANVDIYSTDKTLVQGTIARAFDVTDGFAGLVVLPTNPLTGESVNAPVVMRYTPTANLGAINLGGVNASHRFGDFDTFVSTNFVNFQPDDVTTPFGGLVCDPFETPESHSGFMIYGGARYNFGQDERTKIGFEYNYGSKYWFNFAQAEDDILAPKTSARGNVYETYFTHRIADRFIFKGDYTYYDYIWSGSGWHVGAPKRLDEMPILGFPTYSNAHVLTASLMVRF
jgi:hypothetical protein